MRFESPMWLWLLPIAALLTVAYLIAQRRRSRYAVRFAALPMLEKVAPNRPGWRRHVPAAAFLAALVVLTIAIARPVADVRVPRERATVVVAMDTSISMRATDVSPSRAQVAQRAAVEFVEALPEQFNVGVVAFSGTTSVEARPSTDHEAAIQAIRGLTLDESTAIGEAVFTGLDAITGLDARAAEDPPPARLVLLSDGANTTGRSTQAAAEAAAEANVPVTTIAYGTPDGTIRIGAQDVPVPVDAEALRALADDSGGTFYTAENDTELRTVYSDLESSIGWRWEEREITTLLAGFALGAAVLAGLTSLLWFARLP
jgi:Ca-activated chloride channel homolog